MKPASLLFPFLAMLEPAVPQDSGSTKLEQRDMIIGAADRARVLDGVLTVLQDIYVFPEIAARMVNDVRARRERKEYDSITSAEALAERLTGDLQAISHDKHLRVRYHEDQVVVGLGPQDGASDGGSPGPGSTTHPSGSGRKIVVVGGNTHGQEDPPPDFIEKKRREFALDNFGFQRVERLPGNVGYIDLRAFPPSLVMGETCRAAFDFVAHTDALILDLRRNGGGSPDGVRMVCSYLFGPEPVHLNSIYDRPSDHTDEFWTLEKVNGRRYLNRDVYVLMSSRTFSGGEECAYDLQAQGRATLVGETTGGGANPGGPVPVHEHFEVFVPAGRAVNPITKTNWEGVGVKPTVAIEARLALPKAHALALEKLLSKATDPAHRLELEEGLKACQAELATTSGR